MHRPQHERRPHRGRQAIAISAQLDDAIDMAPVVGILDAIGPTDRPGSEGVVASNLLGFPSTWEVTRLLSVQRIIEDLNDFSGDKKAA